MTQSRMRVRASLAMLYPRVREIELGEPARTFPVIELRIRDIARIEDDAAILAGHPRNRNADLFDLIETRKDEFKRLPSSERQRLGKEYFRAQGAWPPRMGGSDFGEIMSSPEGSIAFLWNCLRRTNRGLTPPDAVDLAAGMEPHQWEAVEKVAWGYQPWEAFALDGKASNRPGRGIDWGEAVDELSQARGWTYRQIGDLYIGQFLNARTKGSPRDVTLAEWPG